MLESLVLIAASFIVYATGATEAKFCNCNVSQNIMITNQDSIYIKEVSKSKCVADIDLVLKITPEDQSDFLTKEYKIALVSSTRGILFQQTSVGSPQIQIKEKLVSKRKEKIWIQVSSTGKYLLSISPQ